MYAVRKRTMMNAAQNQRFSSPNKFIANAIANEIPESAKLIAVAFAMSAFACNVSETERLREPIMPLFSNAVTGKIE